MKMPLCACGHKLSEHASDEGEFWDKKGFCTVGWWDKRDKFTADGCQCAEFTLRLGGAVL